jgi:hypothetical protein
VDRALAFLPNLPAAECRQIPSSACLTVTRSLFLFDYHRFCLIIALDSHQFTVSRPGASMFPLPSRRVNGAPSRTARARRSRRQAPGLEWLESRCLLAVYTVTTALSSEQGKMSFRQALDAAASDAA